MNNSTGKPPKFQITRDQLEAGESLCEHCTAKCCHYFAVSIERPRSYRDFEFIRWYLLHDRATVFAEKKSWYLMVFTTCKHLRDDYRCGIYESRPLICREYTTDECEYDQDFTFDRYFETPEQIIDYCEAIFNEPPATDFRSPRPNPLTVIQ